MPGEFASSEAEQFWGFIVGSLDRLMELVRSSSEAELHWKPPARDGNTIFVLGQHTIGNAADNILATLGGQPVQRDRESEFETAVSRGDLIARWEELRPQLEAQMRKLTSGNLLALLEHPRRGAISGLGILIVVARHAAEHLGQAELTRDMAREALLG